MTAAAESKSRARQVGQLFAWGRLEYHRRVDLQCERPLSQAQAARLASQAAGFVITRHQVARLEACPAHGGTHPAARVLADLYRVPWDAILDAAGIATS